MCQDESNSPHSYEDRSPRRTKQKRIRPSLVGGFFHARPSLVLELSETIDVEATLYIWI